MSDIGESAVTSLANQALKGGVQWAGTMAGGGYRSFTGSEALTGANAPTPSYLPYNFDAPFTQLRPSSGAKDPRAQYTPGRGFRFPGGGGSNADVTAMTGGEAAAGVGEAAAGAGEALGGLGEIIAFL